MNKSFISLIIYSLVLCSIMTNTIHAQYKDLTVEEYIDRYKDIAIQEMERSGIPASITLAQGIHESAFGNSTLARKANNHFGIKCTSDWKGKSYHKWDDEIKKSCFRVYESAIGSYLDHTDFLVNRKHYAFLFKYDKTDYKNWAKGLRKAGYATDPKYPTKLINTIEKYKLAEYDKATGTLVFDDKNNSKIKDIASFDGETSFRTKKRSFLFPKYQKGFAKRNGVTHAFARKTESSLALAKRFGIPYKRFLKFNDLKDGDQLIAYQYAYIANKKASYRGKEAFHKVKNDETMYEIAQYYGIKLHALLYKNRMVEGEEPANDVLILLKDRVAKRPKLRPTGHIDAQPKDEDKKEQKKEDKVPKKLPKAVTAAKVERPKPAKVKINTPTYNEDIYKKKINTAKTKDSTYLKTKISNTTTTTIDDNPYSSGMVKKNVENQTTTTNTTDKVNRNALFQKTTTKPVEGQKNTTIPTRTTISKVDNPYSSSTVNTVVTPVTTQKPVTSAVSTGKFLVHIVKKGETLFSLYRVYKVSVNEIKSYNKLTSDTIKMGQEIKIPLNK